MLQRKHGQEYHDDADHAGWARQNGDGKRNGMANMETSKGNMRGACMHYMKAQKMGMMKESPGGGMKM